MLNTGPWVCPVLHAVGHNPADFVIDVISDSAAAKVCGWAAKLAVHRGCMSSVTGGEEGVGHSCV